MLEQEENGQEVEKTIVYSPTSSESVINCNPDTPPTSPEMAPQDSSPHFDLKVHNLGLNDLEEQFADQYLNEAGFETSESNSPILLRDAQVGSELPPIETPILALSARKERGSVLKTLLTTNQKFSPNQGSDCVPESGPPTCSEPLPNLIQTPTTTSSSLLKDLLTGASTSSDYTASTTKINELDMDFLTDIPPLSGDIDVRD
ncbi:unnamed protein product [Dimorphilus gyrociliatus]|uniref:Uncharacterized protein n=1 Tax=Dimorphilus gyrociliatus TaxID=2664684 RepID=A0A7I8W372_9ANNE|nr:unnamed protein product [Dimorphilus gyrociliatus]